GDDAGGDGGDVGNAGGFRLGGHRDQGAVGRGDLRPGGAGHGQQQGGKQQRGEKRGGGAETTHWDSLAWASSAREGWWRRGERAVSRPLPARRGLQVGQGGAGYSSTNALSRLAI